jgi:diguanylate cyclase (GGDEF)-like protein/PAS domain S-box-containing protein
VENSGNIEQQYHNSREMFEASFRSASIGKAIVAVSGHCIEVNAALADMLGFSRQAMVGMHFSDFTFPADLQVDLHLFNAVMRGERDTYQLEKRYVRCDGEVLDVLLSATCIRDTSGAPIQFISEVVDLTERNRVRRDLQYANAQLRQLVVTDHITGLYNRRGFEEALAEPFACENVAILLIDLDHFKRVNDELGHTAGDLVLVEVGRRLLPQVCEGDLIARVGGDEFGVLLRHADCMTASTIAERIVRELGFAFHVSGQTAQIGGSVGVSCSSGSRNAHEMLNDADTALYAAKRAGRGRWKLAA